MCSHTLVALLSLIFGITLLTQIELSQGEPLVLLTAYVHMCLQALL